MSTRFDLDDKEWGLIEPLLPQGLRGARRTDDRRVLNGIFYVLRTGCPWRDLPERYGPYTTCYNRYNRWTKRGVPAYEIETLVLNAMKTGMSDVKKLSGMLSLDFELHSRTLEYISKSADTLHDLHKAIKRVIIDCDRLTIEICSENLARYINEVMKVDIRPDGETKHYRIEIPYHTKRASRGAVMIRPDDVQDPLDLPKAKLESLVKGIVWRDEHFAGKSFLEIARENGCSPAQVGKLINRSLEIA